MKLFVIVLACFVACASAKPSAWWGHGHHAIAGLVHGHDDGQWHGEGLLESQDWGHHGAWAHGHVFPHGHGAVVAGPSGTIVAHGHHGAVFDHHGHHW